MSTGFCELWDRSTLSTRACCVTSAELTIKKTQRQLQSENLLISNLKMNFHHICNKKTSNCLKSQGFNLTELYFTLVEELQRFKDFRSSGAVVSTVRSNN